MTICTVYRSGISTDDNLRFSVVPDIGSLHRPLFCTKEHFQNHPDSFALPFLLILVLLLCLENMFTFDPFLRYTSPMVLNVVVSGYKQPDWIPSQGIYRLTPADQAPAGSEDLPVQGADSHLH